VTTVSKRKAFYTYFGCLLVCCGSLFPALGDTSDVTGQAQSAFERGAFNQAAAEWEKDVAMFRSRGDQRSVVTTSISLADAYQAIGQHRRAVQLLQEALATSEALGKSGLTTLVRSRLGAALATTTQYEEADTFLTQALEAARAEGNSTLISSILNDLGNSLAAQQKYSEALALFAEAATIGRGTTNAWLTARALCNAGSTAAQAGAYRQADDLTGQALSEIERLEPVHGKAFLLLSAALTDLKIGTSTPDAKDRLLLRAHTSLTQALGLAETLKDLQIKTYALGYLAQLYERDGQVEPALDLAARAIFAAQQAQMPEALYRWEWQSGRLLNSRNEVEPAIAAYRRAVQTLKTIRNDVSLGPGNLIGRPSFRDSDGPLFFELADLLLQQAKATTDPKREQAFLTEARDTVEQLKAVELEDYFCDDCVDVARAKSRSVEAVDEHTAVVYLIPLPTRTEILVGLTSGLKRFTSDVNAERLAEEVRRFRRNLETRTTYGYLEQATGLYDLLIGPIHALLQEKAINTLVFIPDGALRTIPFASLHSGERFLIEDFAIAVAPGLTLVEPRPIKREHVRLLLNGLSESVQGYPSLDFVPKELQTLKPMYASQTLMNNRFTTEALKRQLDEEQYSMVHIASHGQFDRDVRKTFILTYDGKLTLNDLEALIRPSKYRGKPVELLALSACQTAAGDDRAALGLAGVAVKAGVRSALATLWFVNDQSTSTLVSELYEQLRSSPDISKARALQAAQIKLLNDRRYSHPCYWSPYLIIGNWL
jgi:CHAT domain-containing protein/Tfp pilus assembly protein PilF